MKRPLLFSLSLLLLASSCREKIDLSPIESTHKKVDWATEDKYKEEFAKAIAKALENENFRRFIKKEASMMFDNDTDILAAYIKDKKVDETNTFTSFMKPYFENPKDFDKILKNVPLITIFVPRLLTFSAESWDINKDIPLVAVQANDHNSYTNPKVNVYNSKGDVQTLNTNEDPNLPVVVIKECERVIFSDNSSSRLPANFDKSLKLIKTAGGGEYYFSCESANNLTNSRSRTIDTYSEVGSISNVVSDSRFACPEVHRDYVYYGISSRDGILSGSFNSSHWEYIRSVKFRDLGALSKASDDWSEGYLDLKFKVIAISRDAAIQTTDRNYVASTNSFKDNNGTIEVNTDIQLFPWDLKLYGDKFLIEVEEYDITGKDTMSSSFTNKFGSNFELNVGGGEKKIGLKFGSSSTFDISGSVSYERQVGPDYFGQAFIMYEQPIITSAYATSTPPFFYARTFENSTGSIDMSVEPKKMW